MGLIYDISLETAWVYGADSAPMSIKSQADFLQTDMQIGLDDSEFRFAPGMRSEPNLLMWDGGSLSLLASPTSFLTEDLTEEFGRRRRRRKPPPPVPPNVPPPRQVEIVVVRARRTVTMGTVVLRGRVSGGTIISVSPDGYVVETDVVVVWGQRPLTTQEKEEAAVSLIGGAVLTVIKTVPGNKAEALALALDAALLAYAGMNLSYDQMEKLIGEVILLIVSTVGAAAATAAIQAALVSSGVGAAAAVAGAAAIAGMMQLVFDAWASQPGSVAAARDIARQIILLLKGQL